MPDSWMLARLQWETELYHGDADTHRLALLDGTMTVDGYRDFLGRVFGFEMPIEAAFSLTLGFDELIDVSARGQIRLLRADLLHLGVLDPASLPRCRSIRIHDVPDALGWAFVIERNTAFHGIVERHLRDRFPNAMRGASSYLAAHERTGARWRELGDAMDRVATRPSIADRISNAAKSAFRCQRRWYELAEPHIAKYG
jgi:heme oxygenase